MANKYLLFGLPGAGLDQLQDALDSSQYVCTGELVEARSGQTISDLVISGADLAALEDAAFAAALESPAQFLFASGSELTRTHNQEAAKAGQRQLIEVVCDLTTMLKRLEFNRPQGLGLGPVRAQLRQFASERRQAWSGLNPAIIDTSAWSDAQFSEVIGRLCEGKF